MIRSWKTMPLAAQWAPLLCVLGAASAAGATEPHPAVCRVVVQEREGQAFGSGTLIDTRDTFGLVLTNWHVVRDAVGTIEVHFPGGFRSEAKPVKLDETWDLAALVIWRPPTEAVRLASEAPSLGDSLSIHGYGLGNYRRALGRCTDYYAPEEGMPRELVELDVEARQGDSGGPILNARGELAGVLFGAGQGTTLGAFGGRVDQFLTSIGVGAQRIEAVEVAQRGPPSSGKDPGPPSALDPFLHADQLAASDARPSVRPQDRAPTTIAATLPPQSQRPFDASAIKTASTLPTAIHTTMPRARQGMVPQRSVAVPLAWGPTQRSTRGPRLAPLPSGNEQMQPQGIDWSHEGRTLLALFGLTAIAVQGVRVLV